LTKTKIKQQLPEQCYYFGPRQGHGIT
jgi:hypothetical protein